VTGGMLGLVDQRKGRSGRRNHPSFPGYHPMTLLTLTAASHPC
jgi:hypothetical protein